MCSFVFPLYEQFLPIFLASDSITSFWKEYFPKRREQQTVQSVALFLGTNYSWTSLCDILSYHFGKHFLLFGEPEPQRTPNISYQPIMLHRHKPCRKQLRNIARKYGRRPETGKRTSTYHFSPSSADKWFLFQQRHFASLSKVHYQSFMVLLDGYTISTHLHSRSVLWPITNSTTGILLQTLSNSSTVLLMFGMESLSI